MKWWAVNATAFCASESASGGYLHGTRDEMTFLQIKGGHYIIIGGGSWDSRGKFQGRPFRCFCGQHASVFPSPWIREDIMAKLWLTKGTQEEDRWRRQMGGG